MLTNNNQKKLVDAVNVKIHDYRNFASIETGPSGTFVPFFDTTIPDDQK